jgi:hypothetical protein
MRALIATDLSEASLAAVDAVASCNPVDFSGIVLVHAVDLDSTRQAARYPPYSSSPRRASAP